MSKNKQRTGIFDLDNVNTIQLSSARKDLKESIPIINNPKILVDATEIKVNNNKIPISKAILIVKEQMKVSGIRTVTMQEYIYVMNRFTREMELVYLNEITLDKVFEWLSKLGDVSNVTKQSKLRVLKAMLNRFYENGWFEQNWWKSLKIKADEQIKPPADEQQLAILLSMLDMSDFIQFRDAVAILTMYKTGIRVATLIQLEEKHIDFETNTLNLTGDIMKNHEILKLPFDDMLANYLKRLIEQNNIIRKHH